MSTKVATGLQGAALEAWRGYLLSHAPIMRALEADLVHQHGLSARDYEVLLFLAQAPEQRLAMSELADRTMLTRSGITRLVDGLQRSGLVRRVSCASDARIAYATLTEAGLQKLRAAGRTHAESVHEVFLQHFSEDEIEELGRLLGRLPGSPNGGSCTIE